MAIKRIQSDDQTTLDLTIANDDDRLDLVINNGDLRVLREVCAEWGFKDEESVLRYALAVLSKARNEVLYYENEEGGEKIGLKPSSSLRAQESPKGDASS